MSFWQFCAALLFSCVSLGDVTCTIQSILRDDDGLIRVVSEDVAVRTKQECKQLTDAKNRELKAKQRTALNCTLTIRHPQKDGTVRLETEKVHADSQDECNRLSAVRNSSFRAPSFVANAVADDASILNCTLTVRLTLKEGGKSVEHFEVHAASREDCKRKAKEWRPKPEVKVDKFQVSYKFLRSDSTN